MGSSSSRASSTSSVGSRVSSSSSLFSSSSSSATKNNNSSNHKWTDYSYVKKLILEKKLAPRATEQGEKGGVLISTSARECPICFLDVSLMNTSKCCKQPICTGCFVSLAQQKSSSSSSSSSSNNSNPEVCVFCAKPGFDVFFHSDIDIVVANPSVDYLASSGDKQPILGSTPISFSSNKLSEKEAVSVPLASKADRVELERQISQQNKRFSESGSRSSSTAAASLSPPSSQRASGAPSPQRLSFGHRHHRRSSSSDDDDDGGYLGSPVHMHQRRSALETIEQMMLNEAIRLSMADIPKNSSSSSKDEARATTTRSTENSSNHLPAPEMDRDLAAINIEMSESEQLNLALSLSLKDVERSAAAAPLPCPNGSTDNAVGEGASDVSAEGGTRKNVDDNV